MLVKYMDANHVRKLMRKAIQDAGNAKAWAQSINVTPQFISMVLNGKEPSVKILDVLGLEKAPPSYRRKQGEMDNGA